MEGKGKGRVATCGDESLLEIACEMDEREREKKSKQTVDKARNQ